MAPRRKLSTSVVLAALRELQLAAGQPPTIEELRVRLGVGSTRTVLRYLQELEAERLIERWPGARGIKITSGRQDHSVDIVPVLGEAPAGALMDAEENRLGSVRLVRPDRERGKLFLLRVRGDSMNRAVVNGRTIEDGDLILVRQGAEARTGAVVVALVDGRATIKRLALGPHYAVLKPESDNPRHTPIIVSEDLSLQGVVIDVIKDGAVNVWDA
jgi:repressor LexA